MTEHKTPTLIMGHIEIMTRDGGEGIPYDRAVIHFEGDEESEIEIYSPEALRLAPFIVSACNSHDALVKALQVARIHLTTLGGDNRPDPNSDQIQAAVLDAVDAALTAAGAPHER